MVKEYSLKQLSVTDGKDYYNMLRRIGKNENDFTNPVHDMTFEEFQNWLKQQDEWSVGDNLPQGYVPQFCYWLVVNEVPAGFGKIRTKLTEKSRLEGGNIGYAIDPQARGNGLGSKLLELLLLKAKELNIDKPLVTVKKYNYASKRVAEHNGGVLIKETDTWWYYEMYI